MTIKIGANQNTTVYLMWVTNLQLTWQQKPTLTGDDGIEWGKCSTHLLSNSTIKTMLIQLHQWTKQYGHNASQRNMAETRLVSPQGAGSIFWFAHTVKAVRTTDKKWEIIHQRRFLLRVVIIYRCNGRSNTKLTTTSWGHIPSVKRMVFRKKHWQKYVHLMEATHHFSWNQYHPFAQDNRQCTATSYCFTRTCSCAGQILQIYCEMVRQ